jgi:sulfatase modifying factor 1
MKKIGIAATVCIIFGLFLIKTKTPLIINDFVEIPAGNYWIGAVNNPLNPKRQVKLQRFYIHIHEVTNREFKQFVQATDYVTTAERLKNAMIFFPGLEEYEWKNDTTAYWEFPNGQTRSNIENKQNHPVTCISFSDVKAYCKWANVRLPTLEEWEVVSRAKSKKRYYWGSVTENIYKNANIWKGETHQKVAHQEIDIYTSPVKSYLPNDWGIYDIYGNVFEFCENKPDLLNAYPSLVCARGGSWWCSTNSCNYFNSVDIGRIQRLASFSNQGFRVVKDEL